VVYQPSMLKQMVTVNYLMLLVHVAKMNESIPEIAIEILLLDGSLKKSIRFPLLNKEVYWRHFVWFQ